MIKVKLPKIEEEHTLIMEAPISRLEIKKKATDKLKRNKAPAMDEYTGKFDFENSYLSIKLQDLYDNCV